MLPVLVFFNWSKDLTQSCGLFQILKAVSLTVLPIQTDSNIEVTALETSDVFFRVVDTAAREASVATRGFVTAEETPSFNEKFCTVIVAPAMM